MTEMERENGLARRPRHQMRREERSDNKMLPLRNILNLVFMLGSARLGIIIVLVAMAVKMVECAIRMIVK